MAMSQPPMGVAPVVMVKSQKSVGVAIVLSFFFGPFGMFYSTVTGAIVMLVLDIIVVPILGVLTLGLGFGLYLFTGIGGIIWAAVAASNHNKAIGIAAMPMVAAVTPGVVAMPGSMPNPYPQQPGSMPSPYQGQSGPYQQPGSMPSPYQGQSGPYQQPGSAPSPYQGQSGPYQTGQQPPQYPG